MIKKVDHQEFQIFIFENLEVAASFKLAGLYLVLARMSQGLVGPIVLE